MATHKRVAGIVAEALGLELVSLDTTHEVSAPSSKMKRSYEEKLGRKEGLIGDRARFNAAVARIMKAKMSDDNKYIYLAHFLDQYIEQSKTSSDDRIIYDMPKRISAALKVQDDELGEKYQFIGHLRRSIIFFESNGSHIDSIAKDAVRVVEQEATKKEADVKLLKNLLGIVKMINI